MMTNETYISTLDKHIQKQLDELISRIAVYCNTGYDDIIIPRDSIFEFINGLTNIGVVIASINWWCNMTIQNMDQHGCPHGYSGPETKAGRFSGMYNDVDDIEEIEKDLFYSLLDNCKHQTIEKLNKIALNTILNKRIIIYPQGLSLTFKQNPCLTPGFDLCVPENWKWKEKV